jgi:hypothetical protein
MPFIMLFSYLVAVRQVMEVRTGTQGLIMIWKYVDLHESLDSRTANSPGPLGEPQNAVNLPTKHPDVWLSLSFYIVRLQAYHVGLKRSESCSLFRGHDLGVTNHPVGNLEVGDESEETAACQI